MEEDRERKQEKEQGLEKDHLEVQVHASRVCCRSFTSHSLTTAYGRLGIKGANHRRVLRDNVVAAKKKTNLLLTLVEEGRKVGAIESFLDTGQDFTSLGWVALRKIVFVRPETSCNPRKQQFCCFLWDTSLLAHTCNSYQQVRVRAVCLPIEHRWTLR